MTTETDMNAHRPILTLTYCTQCRWLLRAAWLAQELLTTFEAEIGGVTLIPGSGGVFEVRVDQTLVWSRRDEGRFPETKELKQKVRDLIAPDRDLGHSDTLEHRRQGRRDGDQR